MKLATWNVNSLRAREDQVLDWIETEAPDILCMQETKVTDQEFPEDAFGDLGYDVMYFGQPAYNGVAIASKEEPSRVMRGLPGDPEDADRRLIAATIAGVRVLSVYVPNGQSIGTDKYAYKLDWLERLRAFLSADSTPEDPIVVCGDLNIAPADVDVWNPAERAGSLFVSGPERRAFSALIEWGLVDAFRHFHPTEKRYSWWDYRAGSFERNRGMRIDHLLVSRPVLARGTSVTIDRRTRALEAPSDHVPVVMELSS